MKIMNIFAAAGIAIAALGVSTAAAADPGRGDRWERSYHDNGRHRGWDRGDHRGWDRRDDRRWYHGRRITRHCWAEWRHGHRVRVCR